MNACFNQSTKHSDTSTMMAGEKIVWRRERDGEGNEREKRDKEGVVVVEESSMRFRRAMMKSIRESWNRSTMSIRKSFVTDCQKQRLSK